MDYVAQLKALPKQHDFFIGIDSDGPAIKAAEYNLRNRSAAVTLIAQDAAKALPDGDRANGSESAGTADTAANAITADAANSSLAKPARSPASPSSPEDTTRRHEAPSSSTTRSALRRHARSAAFAGPGSPGS